MSLLSSLIPKKNIPLAFDLKSSDVLSDYTGKYCFQGLAQVERIKLTNTNECYYRHHPK